MNTILENFTFLALCGLVAVGCTKEGETDSPIYGGEAKDNQVTVESDSGPRNRQKHRSSDNFSTNSLIGNGDYLLWMTDCEEDVTFDVMEDISFGDDKDAFISLSNGSITTYKGIDKLYIADPRNATRSFQVTVSRIEGNEGSEYVNCAKDVLPGQKNRASGNFRLKYGKKYQVITPYECTFSIWNDKTGSDDTLMTKVRNGRIIAGFEEQNIYVADVANAPKAFTVEFKPYEQAQSSWMGQLPDDTKVSMMSIPGTHDTGTYVFDLGLAKCQNYDIYTQLIDGIRWLDIRLSDDLNISHTIESNLSFTSVMAQINQFLSEYPSEAVFMMIKNDDDDFYTKFRKWYDDNLFNPDETLTSSRMIIDDKMLDLGDIRGKIVLFRRFAYSGSDPCGIDLSQGWPQDASGTLTAEYNGGTVLFYIEDRYFSIVEDDHDTNEKVSSIKSAFDMIQRSDDQVHFLIYNSIAGHIVGRYAWDYAWGASGIDPYMMEGLNDLMDIYYPEGTQGRTGVIMLDYYNKHSNDDPFHLVERIINTNFSSPIINY